MTQFLSFNNTSFKFLARLVVNSKYTKYFIKIPEGYFFFFFYPSLRHDVTNAPFNNLIDSSFEAERASVGKHGDIFPTYGFFFNLNHNLVSVVNTHPLKAQKSQ